MSRNKNQKQAILDAFKLRRELTPSDILRMGIAQYNARIKELREEGYIIESEYLGRVDGAKRTKFVYRGKVQKPDLKSTKTAIEIAAENRLKYGDRPGQISMF